MESSPVIVKVYTPTAAEPVSICSVLVAGLPIVTTGLVPKIADAPAGRPTALSVVSHGRVFPVDVTVRRPKEAIAPGATDTSVGTATEMPSGFALKAERAPAQGTRATASIRATLNQPRLRGLSVRGMAGTREFNCIDKDPWLRTLGQVARPIHEGKLRRCEI
jgi:hypothetical protein